MVLIILKPHAVVTEAPFRLLATQSKRDKKSSFAIQLSQEGFSQEKPYRHGKRTGLCN